MSRILLGAATSIWLGLGLVSANSQTVESFYRDKQVRLIIHSTTGGDYDGWARLVARYMTKYVPGNPTFIAQNMPGAGGITAANTLYSSVPKDGSVIGMIGRNLPFQALTKVANVRYEPTKFNWIGSPEYSNIVCIVVGDAPAKTADELYVNEVLMGGAGAGTAVSLMPVFLNRLLGMKFRLVEGYNGASAVRLAMDRREVQGVFLTYAAIKTASPQALESGDLKILFNMEPEPVPGLKAPSIFAYAKSDDQRQLLKLMSISNELGRPMLAPPDVPADRVAALREAFDKSMADADLRSDAIKSGFTIAETKGAALAKLVDDLMATPKRLVEQFEELMK